MLSPVFGPSSPFGDDTILFPQDISFDFHRQYHHAVRGQAPL